VSVPSAVTSRFLQLWPQRGIWALEAKEIEVEVVGGGDSRPIGQSRKAAQARFIALRVRW